MLSVWHDDKSVQVAFILWLKFLKFGICELGSDVFREMCMTWLRWFDYVMCMKKKKRICSVKRTKRIIWANELKKPDRLDYFQMKFLSCWSYEWISCKRNSVATRQSNRVALCLALRWLFLVFCLIHSLYSVKFDFSNRLNNNLIWKLQFIK